MMRIQSKDPSPAYLRGRAREIFENLSPRARVGYDSNLLAAFSFGQEIIERAHQKLNDERDPETRLRLQEVIKEFTDDARMFAPHLTPKATRAELTKRRRSR